VLAQDDIAKRKLDKSVFSESMGVNDETLAGFDEYLSPTLSDNPENTPGISNNIEVDSITATDDLNYLMNKIKKDKKSKYHILEEQRKQRLATAKVEDRQKREALDQRTLRAKAAAYQKGLADSQTQQEAFNDTSTKPPKKLNKNGLAFSTYCFSLFSSNYNTLRNARAKRVTFDSTITI